MPWRLWRRRRQGWWWKKRRRGISAGTAISRRRSLLVKDTLQALGDLARERRRRYQTPVVALTGSNGKTTTKEMIAACLETTFPVLKNRGNWNNLIGLPLTLLRLTEKERVVVLEMGMNVPGEIRRLTEIAEPDVGLITNIQKVHLEGLGSLERLKEEKGELFRRMRRDGTIVVNQRRPPGGRSGEGISRAEDHLWHRGTFGCDGQRDPAQGDRTGPLSPWSLKEKRRRSFSLCWDGILFRMPSRPSPSPALFGIDLKRVKEVLEHFRPAPMRMEIVPLGGREDPDQRCL